MADEHEGRVIPVLTPEDRRAKEAVLAMAEHQRAAAEAVIRRLRRELGFADIPKDSPELTT